MKSVKAIAMKWTVIVVLISSGQAILRAQYHNFGRNKIQYTDFDWYVLSTEHFEIHYYPEMEELALIGAQYAEESYRVLENKFNHSLNRKVPLIFYSSHLYFQQTNVIPNILPEGVGGFFEYMKGRVVIPSDGSISQFKRVIRHELVHVFMHSKVSRVQKNHGILNPRYPPLWFSEGLAEYWSGKWDTQAEMVMRDAILSGYFVPVSKLYTIFGTFLMYKEGQNLCGFMADKYGEEKLLLLMENFWRQKKFSEVVKLTLGVDYGELDRLWTYDLQKKYYPLLKDKDKPGMVSKKLDDRGFNTKPEVYTNAEGKQMVAYVGNKTGYTSIYERPLESEPETKPTLLVQGEKSSEYETFHLFRSSINISTNRVLAFVTKSGETDVIHRFDIDRKISLKPLKFKDIVSISSPKWSLDGKMIAFVGLSRSGYNDIYCYKIEGGRLLKLTNDFYDDRDPVWSPDGNKIAFSSDRTATGDDGYYNLFTVGVEDLEVRYLTYGEFNDRAPDWAEDGRIILYSDRDGMNNIWVLEPNQESDFDMYASLSGDIEAVAKSRGFGGLYDYNARRVTNFTTAALDPVWVGDGTIVFTSFEDFSFRIERTKKLLKPRTNEIPYQVQLVRNGIWEHKTFDRGGGTFGKRYKGGYSLDIAQSQVTQDPLFGTSGGAAFALSDVLGNNKYYFLIYNNARTSDEILKSFNVALTKISLSGRTNFAYGVFHLTGRRFNYHEGFYDERRYGGFFSLAYPLSFFKRIEASSSFSYSDKDRIAIDSREAWLVTNFLTYVVDNSLWGPTGPMDGKRLMLAVGYTNDVRYSNVNYYTLIADYRRYYRISRRTSFATRWMVLYSDGSEAERFYIGGSWTLRGYRRFSIWGRKAFLINNEFRFPFIDLIGIQFPFGGLGLRQIRGALFVDAGNAWEDVRGEILGSYGYGLRLRIGGYLVLRIDWGRYTNFRSLPKGTFKQFFFGWDF